MKVHDVGESEVGKALLLGKVEWRHLCVRLVLYLVMGVSSELGDGREVGGRGGRGGLWYYGEASFHLVILEGRTGVADVGSLSVAS